MANKPNNPSLWSKAKSLAKQKFDVYPSAYANGWAAKWYKSKGGTWRKAQYGMEIPEMQVGGYFPRFMQEGGEPDGGMALGQVNAVLGKLAKLREFIQPDSDLEPWISSKLAVMDHYADAVYDEMMYGEIGDEGEEYEEEGEEEDEEEEEEEAPMTENELEEMKNGGIPERYRKRGFTKVGVKRKSTRPGKKWMVLAKKGDQYKIVHGGYKGMKDFTQHRNKKRQKKFWSRMGGKNSSKATDPFSPLYWHKRFGTWQDGGQMNDNFDNNLNTNFMNPLYDFIQRAQMGGMQQSQEEQIMQLIAMFAQMQGVDPQQVMAQLQQLSAEEQQQAIQQMVEAVQQSAANEQEQMPAMRRGGMYQVGGDVMGGPVGLPAMPADIYGLPIFAGGGMKGYVSNPYVEDMMEMREGGKPEWLIRAQLKAQGFSGDALENKLSQMKQGGIHINPKNKGKFTAKAKRAGMGVQEFAGKVLGAPEGRYSASTRRQANFARNAAGWKKQVGGMIDNLKEGDVLNDVDEETLRMLDQMGIQYKFV